MAFEALFEHCQKPISQPSQGGQTIKSTDEPSRNSSGSLSLAKPVGPQRPDPILGKRHPRHPRREASSAGLWLRRCRHRTTPKCRCLLLSPSSAYGKYSVGHFTRSRISPRVTWFGISPAHYCLATNPSRHPQSAGPMGLCPTRQWIGWLDKRRKRRQTHAVALTFFLTVDNQTIMDEQCNIEKPIRTQVSKDTIIGLKSSTTLPSKMWIHFKEFEMHRTPQLLAIR